MLLSDNVSLLLPVPQPLQDLPLDPDPAYFFDLKLHFRKDPAHWKNVKQYRKTRSDIRENKYRMDGEINYIKDEIKTFHQDIENFIRTNPFVDAREGAQAFCSKWRGYSLTYDVETENYCPIPIENGFKCPNCGSFVERGQGVCVEETCEIEFIWRGLFL